MVNHNNETNSKINKKIALKSYHVLSKFIFREINEKVFKSLMCFYQLVTGLSFKKEGYFGDFFSFVNMPIRM